VTEEARLGGAGAVMDIAGGKAMFVGPDSPMNSVKGAGMNGPVMGAELDAIAAFFRLRGCAAAVAFDACPFADDSLAALIAERRWPFAGFEQVLWRAIGGGDLSEFEVRCPAGLAIDVVGEARAEEWAMLLARVFSGLAEPPRWQVEIGLRGFGAPGGTAWAVLDGERMIGAARLFIHDRAAHLSGAAVLPAYRGRGLQTALLAARIRRAIEEGCDLAKIDTKAGTTSQRNAHRMGFEVAYTRAQFMMPL
jgi:ribosomal protein S18 acetylase RimI-like enzyme